LYPWRTVPRIAMGALAAALVVLAAPLLAMVVGLVVFPLDFGLKMVGASGAGGLVGSYLSLAQAAFAPEALPTWLPRLGLLLLRGAAVAVMAEGWLHGEGPSRGSIWWAAVRPPLSAQPIVEHTWRVMWDLVRGAAPLRQPSRGDLVRRYTEMLA